MSTDKPETSAPIVRLHSTPPLLRNLTAPNESDQGQPIQGQAAQSQPVQRQPVQSQAAQGEPAQSGTTPSDIPHGVSRRTLIGMGAAAIMAGVASGSAFGPGAVRADAAGYAAARTGTLADVKHVVVLMQENRSFDHYFGSLAGVRGFDDRQMLEYPGGGNVFAQPDPTRTDGGVLLPFPLDSANFNAQNAAGLDHSWEGGHVAYGNGAWNSWVTAKSAQTMGYFTRDDIPYHYALADAFTICDQYHCSLIGPTTPNRLFQWTGTINPAGDKGGPAIDNPPDYLPVFRWGTYGEELQKAGVGWKTYANDEVGDDGAHPYVGDYGDNPLWLFKQYHDALASTDPAVHALAENGGLHDGWKPDSGKGLDVTHLLEAFGADCAANTLPQVSYVVAPYGWSEHPAASPDYGAHFTNAVVQALFSNPETWASTVLIVNFDENDGYFDHVVPPIPESGTADEFVGNEPIGYGTRVPMMVVSPWSRGGWVNSQVFDHTSVIRFLETWTGVADHNISAWRRSVSGDLTSCFDFASPDYSTPALPDTATLVAAANADASKPAVQQPAVGAQRMPKQESGSKKHRALPYQQNANVAVDRHAGTVTLEMQSTGTQSVSMAVYPNIVLPFVATPFLVGPVARSYVWNSVLTQGKYDFSVYGPDGFVRRFAGTVVSETAADVPLPAVTAKLSSGPARGLKLELSNAGSPEVRFTVTANDFAGGSKDFSVGAGAHRLVDWPLANGYYDVIVSADTGTGFSYRFAGKIE